MRGLKITGGDKIRRSKSMRWDGNKYVEGGEERTYQSSRSRGFPGWLKPILVITILAMFGAAVYGLWGNEIANLFYRQPPYSKDLGGERIHLINNKEATDPTWQQLKTFLLTDITDGKDYSLFSFPCGAFAEEVHNNAEAAGIRAAWVAVDFEDNSEEHALNAFETTDKGLVYIDCTGGDVESKFLYRIVPSDEGGFTSMKCSPDSWDKVVYVEVDKEYRQISLEVATSPEYSFYKDYLAKWEEYSSKLETYNQEVDAYSQALGGRLYLEEPEYSEFIAWYNQLNNVFAELNALLEELGDFHWQSLGVVSKIEIYW